MSWVALAPPRPRAGRLACACDLEPPAAAGAVVEGAPGSASAAAVFALTVLAQALTAAVLPVAGAILAPTPLWGAAPFALLLLGAALATLPASLLTDLFGRRAALALGASLGLAGGALASRGFAVGQFSGLALGAFWLGAAQGFGFYYRHAPVTRAASRTRAIGIVFSGGVAAAMLAPIVVSLARSASGPLAPATLLACASAVEVAILILAIGSPAGGAISAPLPALPDRPGRFMSATFAAAGAWFGMSLLMANAAPAMVFCGIGMATASAVIANHLLWMYAPAALSSAWLARVNPAAVAAVGVSLVAGSVLVFWRQSTLTGFAALMAAAGFGWSLAMYGASAMLFETGRPSTKWLALHDGVFFAAGVAGALAGQI